jgi:hypothetical protein
MTYQGHMKNGVAVLDTPVEIPDGTPVRIDVVGRDAGFWRNATVDQLAYEQHVQPIGGVEALGGDWPEEDSVDELLVLLRKVRS